MTFLSSFGVVSDLPALTFIYFSPMWLLLLRGASVRSDVPGPMESFVGSFTPQRAGKRIVQAF